MFRRKNRMPIDVSRLAGLLAHDTFVRGDVRFSGGLRIDGRVEGNVTGSGEGRDLLVLSERGVIVGSVQVHDAVVNGCVEGDLEVGHYLELQAGARVTGNITYGTLKLDCGATVEGKLLRLGEESERGDAEAEPRVVSFSKAP